MTKGAGDTGDKAEAAAMKILVQMLTEKFVSPESCVGYMATRLSQIDGAGSHSVHDVRSNWQHSITARERFSYHAREAARRRRVRRARSHADRRQPQAASI